MKFKFYFLKLSVVMIVIFLLQVFIRGFTEMFVLNRKAYQGEVWRFVTSIFLHGSLTHLLFNLFALVFFGIILEKTIGSERFLIVFFLSGIFANLIAVNFYHSSLGASGAIYGVLGVITVLNPFIMVYAFGFIMPMFIAAILWIAADVLRVLGFNPGNVGAIAHLSGIFIGFLVGILLKKRLKIRKNKKQKVNISDSYVDSWEKKYLR
ncbi:rhomboid family intramembrane serine protease [Candidatus Pacearchaeota archaeon]|nr:rhomboid family intramembrane serine protease [Candidatus Pacearchaeota archaeon]